MSVDVCGCLRLLGPLVACMDTGTGYKTQSYTCSHAGLSTVTLATSKGLFRGCGGAPQAAALKRWLAVSASLLGVFVVVPLGVVFNG